VRDLRVIDARVLLPVDAIAPVRGFWPPSILMTGRDLQKATEILINDVKVLEFIVQDDRHIIARIPDGQVGKQINSVMAFSPISVSYSSAAVELGLTTPIKTLAGVDRLVQSWLIVFFTTPGSTIFDKTSGGGANALIGKTTDAGHQGVAADLALCIDRTKNELMRLQAETPYIPLDERLLSASLTNLFFDPDTSTLNAVVTLDTMSGASTRLSLR
jgi:hypothetical protein